MNRLRFIAAAIVALWAFAFAVWFLTGCAPVRPVDYEATTPSFVDGKQDSGVLVDAHNVPKEWAPAWRDRYNSLIASYGSDPFFKPPLKPDDGITLLPDGNFSATETARVNFFVMNRWQHSGTHQPKTLVQKVGL